MFQNQTYTSIVCIHICSSFVIKIENLKKVSIFVIEKYINNYTIEEYTDRNNWSNHIYKYQMLYFRSVLFDV